MLISKRTIPNNTYYQLMRTFYTILALVLIINIAQAQNVGIGTSDPQQKLDVNGNVKIDGALMPDGEAGQVGQILMSKGTEQAPIWVDPGTIIFDQSGTAVYGSSQVTISTLGAWTQVPGLTYTLFVDTGTVVLVSTFGSVENTADGSNTGCTANLGIFIDGSLPVNGSLQKLSLASNNKIVGGANWAMYQAYALAPGNHTITIRAKLVTRNSTDLVVSGGTGSDMRGVMTIAILRE